MADRSGACMTPAYRLTDRPPPIAENDIGLEVDTGDDGDADSTLEVSSTLSQTTSLASSIARYRVENGRTYHSYKDGSYILPNDEGENERLDLQHHICCLTFDGRLYTCPAGRDRPLRRVLDAGCGTGIWAIDMADEHPEAEITGVDLSPIQPSFVPPNLSFYVDDLEAEWTYHTPFDFIYMRLLMGSIGDWDKLFKQAYNNLTPGGWIELLDAMYPMQCDDDTCPPTKACWRWGDYMNQAAKKLGRSLDSAEENKHKLVEAGFVNVTESVYKWPINPWAKHPKYKEMGMWNLENVVGGLSGLSLALFTRVLGWTVEELEVFLVEVRRDMRDTRIHGYWKIIVVSGQKPDNGMAN